MIFFVLASLVVIAVSVALVLLVRRNLRQRVVARKLRNIFTATAYDLIGKPEFPDKHARQLIEFAAVPQGWLTRFMVVALVKGIIMGRQPTPTPNRPLLDEVPASLRANYVKAILALGLSDSYRCALLGRIWRGAYGWVSEAVEEVKPDVEAHATRHMVGQMFSVHAPRQVKASVNRLECAVA